MIIVTGTVAYDYIMDFPGSFGDRILPDQIHKINISFTVNKFSKRRGGTAGNVSYSLGLLKTPQRLFTVAGKDFEDYKKDFNKLKIPLNDVVIDKTSYTSTGFAMTDTNNNQIWGYFYGASEKIKNLKLRKVTKENDLVLLGPSGIEGTMSFVRQCIDLSLTYIFDLGFIVHELNSYDLEFSIKNAKYVIGNDYEVTFAKRKVKSWNKITKNKIIVTTLGEKGAIIQTSKKTYKIPIAKPKKILDPTGAGDAWRGGFLAGLQKGFTLQICGQMGAVAASFAIENYGSQEHKYTKKDFQNRYRQNFGSLIKL